MPGIFVASGAKGDQLVTKNLVPGTTIYGEKTVSVQDGDEKVEYRVWNPFRSKLGAAVVSGIGNISISPGRKILYLGAASGTSVSHVSDIVGKDGIVYAVEFSNRSGRDLLTMAQKRSNIVPIIEDARHPLKYRMLVPLVDTVFADVAQPDQARIMTLNCHHFLKQGGNVVMSIKANCIDSTQVPEKVFASECEKLKQEKVKPVESITLEPYERDHCMVAGIYRYDPKQKQTDARK